MSKKLIAFMIAATLVFVGVFAACNNNDEEPAGPYIEGDEYEFVTDENGERVLNENGEFIIYYTDENGKIVENENGEKVTVLQDFVPVSEKNIVEDYGYKITLPEGWKSDTIKGSFINEETGDKFKIDVITSTDYADNYQVAKLIYNNAVESGEYEATFEENVTDMGEEFGDLFRLTVKKDQLIILHVFVNNENLYCITYESNNVNTTLETVKGLIDTITFKPYQYYVPTTEETTTSTTESTTSVAD